MTPPAHARWGLRAPDPERAARWRAEGWWNDETLGDLVTSRTAALPDQAIAVHSAVRPSSGTYADVVAEARRLAGGLAARGVGPGDAVACQLPNWREALATLWGAAIVGAVVVPIVHFYGRREVDHILERTEVKALVTTAAFGRLSFLADASDRPALKGLDVLAVVGDLPGTLPDNALSYESLTAAAPFAGRADIDPDSPALVAYTSGTTAEPKGVVHSHRTLGAEIRQVVDLVPALPPRLTSSPLGHVGGMLTGAFTPIVQGNPINLIDAWDTVRVLALMTDHGLASGSGATFFLTALLDAPGLTDEHLALMPHISLGGAPVPEAVARRAHALGLSLTRNYGSTEHPTITGSRHGDPVEQRLRTDGRALPGVELRLVDEAGDDVPIGTPGEILSRGPDRFIGYTDPALTAKLLDADGWYSTEDIGILDADGFLTITDRKKDIIIRGGENISAAEIEEVLAGLPAVAEVAVVAAPDERFGERVCAVVRLRAGATLTLDQLREATAAAGLGRQKWPELLRVVPDFPRTPSGKIRKSDLRTELSGKGQS